jgi:hypothetical protein
MADFIQDFLWRLNWVGVRVAFIGNQGNNAYRMCKWGRSMGVNAHLYHCPKKYNKVRSMPELIDPELASGYPNWVTVLDGGGRPDVFKHYPSIVDHIHRRFRAIVTSGEWGVQELHHFEGPALFHLSLGGDIGDIPWRDWKSIGNSRAQERHRLYQESIRRYKAIFTANRESVAKLEGIGLKGQAKIWAHPEDVVHNKSRTDSALLSELSEKYNGVGRVFIWLSRLIMNPDHYGNKATDVFVKALTRFISQKPDYSVRVIMGDHGPNRKEIKELIEQQKVGHLIDWVKHQPYTHLLAFLSLPQAVIFDELSPQTNWISGMARDTLSVGGVIVRSIDQEYTEFLFGPGCPILHADSVDLCAERMRQLTDDSFFQKQKAAASRWAMEYLHYPRNVKRFYDRIARDLPVKSHPLLVRAFNTIFKSANRTSQRASDK